MLYICSMEILEGLKVDKITFNDGVTIIFTNGYKMHTIGGGSSGCDLNIVNIYDDKGLVIYTDSNLY